MPRRWVSDDDDRVLRELQLGSARLIRDELTLFFGSLNLERPEAVRDALAQFVPELVRKYGAAASTVAADWYDDVRAGLNIRGTYRARVADPVEVERIDRMVRFAAGHLFTATPFLTLAAIQAPASRYVVDQSRFTISGSTLSDPQARGWERRARADGCSFCKALSSRGAVYRRDAVSFASHNDCNCSAVPSWDPDAPEVGVLQYEASQETFGMSDRQKAEHNARIQTMVANFDN